ncbi:hypothetical protein KF728_21595 [Candidatus Obscuribacterales bacterium]|nr:hypothetical protein [Candidatus Obscuribacterales bacterium]MBX3152767.1 hypothetical protein [Candidatus Obscuribacterales bacterium]
MKAKFTVSATLKAGKDRVQAPEPVTPMLMLAKFSGMNLAADLKGLVASSEEKVSEQLSTSGFTGELGEHLTITLGEKSKQKKVLIVGLGKAGRFDCGTVRDTIKVAMNRVVAARCERITIPIMPDRLTSSSLGLMPTAHIIKCVAEDVLEAKDGDGVVEIELLTTPQGKRHVNAGLAKERRSKKPCGVCADVEKPSKSEGKPKDKDGKAAKKDVCSK